MSSLYGNKSSEDEFRADDIDFSEDLGLANSFSLYNYGKIGLVWPYLTPKTLRSGNSWLCLQQFRFGR